MNLKDGRVNGGEQAVRPRVPTAGEVERGAVIDRAADDGQAQRGIDRVVKADVFEHRQSLVVVHRQHRIAAFELVRGEQGVGR